MAELSCIAILDSESAECCGGIVVTADRLILVTGPSLVGCQSLNSGWDDLWEHDLILRVCACPLNRRRCNIRRHREEHLDGYSTNPEELVEFHIRPELIVLVSVNESRSIGRCS